MADVHVPERRHDEQGFAEWARREAERIAAALRIPAELLRSSDDYGR
jgi:hypothetical protein